MARKWIKSKLSDNSISLRAHKIAMQWKSVRKLAVWLPRAIVLYQELQEGRVDMLFEDFPLMKHALRGGAVMSDDLPAIEFKKPEITYEVQTTEDKLAAFGRGLGLKR